MAAAAFSNRDKMECQALVHSNGSTVLRAITSDRYSRFWNYEVFGKLRRQSRIAVDIWPWMVGVVAVMLIPEIALRRHDHEAVSLWIQTRTGTRLAPARVGWFEATRSRLVSSPWLASE